MLDEAACTARDSLHLARSGDSLAFAALVRAHQRMVYSLALRMLSDRHEAEDLAQDVFLQLHRRLTTIESNTHLLFWLRKVTTNLAIDHLRRLPRHKVLPLDREPNIPSDAPEGDPLLQRELRAKVAQLPPAPRAVVLLRYQEDLDPADIAATLDMSLNTVKSHLRRSLAILRTTVEEEIDEGRRS